jgi:hypothetical protein
MNLDRDGIGSEQPALEIMIWKYFKLEGWTTSAGIVRGSGKDVGKYNSR